MSVFIPIVFLAYQICTSLWSAFGVSTTGKWDKYISLNFDRCSRVSASSTLLSMLRSWKCILERAALLPGGGGVPSSLHLHWRTILWPELTVSRSPLRLSVYPTYCLSVCLLQIMKRVRLNKWLQQTLWLKWWNVHLVDLTLSAKPTEFTSSAGSWCLPWRQSPLYALHARCASQDIVGKRLSARWVR